MIAFVAALLVAAVAAPAVPPSLRGKDLERLPTTRKEIVLTIDAGGDAAGGWAMLQTLRRAGVPAHFFLTGRFVERYPRLSRTIASSYPIANHTYSHPQLTRLPSLAVRTEIDRGHRAILRVTAVDARPLFRFPYGDRDAHTIALANRMGYICVRWSVDTWGWMGRSRQSRSGIVRRVVDRLEPGAIVLMHIGASRDGSTLDADALPVVIAAARARGYGFTTLERLAR